MSVLVVDKQEGPSWSFISHVGKADSQVIFPNAKGVEFLNFAVVQDLSQH